MRRPDPLRPLAVCLALTVALTLPAARPAAAEQEPAPASQPPATSVEAPKPADGAAPTADSDLDSVDRYLLSMLAGFAGPENPLGITLTNEGGNTSDDTENAPGVRADLELRMVARDADGGRSPIRSSPFQISMARTELENALEREYIYPLQLLATPLEQTIAVAIADRTTGSVSFDTIRLVAPAPTPAPEPDAQGEDGAPQP
jgi:hypothetical protein